LVRRRGQSSSALIAKAWHGRDRSRWIRSPRQPSFVSSLTYGRFSLAKRQCVTARNRRARNDDRSDDYPILRSWPGFRVHRATATAVAFRNVRAARRVRVRQRHRLQGTFARSVSLARKRASAPKNMFLMPSPFECRARPCLEQPTCPGGTRIDSPAPSS